MSVTTSWEASWRQRIGVLTSANTALTQENVELLEDVLELERRLLRAKELAAARCHDPYIRRIERALDGDPHELKRGHGGAAAGDAGRGGVDPDPPAGGGTGAGGGPVPAGGVHGAPDPGGSDGVPGPVEAVAAWPYTRPGGAEHVMAGGVAP